MILSTGLGSACFFMFASFRLSALLGSFLASLQSVIASKPQKPIILLRVGIVAPEFLYEFSSLVYIA